jgi:multisubunit Na+/H+ antiporter MnhF subunit
VAILLLWGQAFGIAALFDVAIVLALLSAVSVAAMTRLAPKHD